MSFGAALGLLAAQSEVPTGGDSGALVLGLAVALIGALGTSGFQFYKYRRQAQREDDSLIATATGEAVKAAKEMLSEYRLELQRARDEMKELRDKLEEANGRIIKLELELAQAREDRSRLQDELTKAIERRAEMRVELEHVQRRMEDLEHIVQGVSAREEAREDVHDPPQ